MSRASSSSSSSSGRILVYIVDELVDVLYVANEQKREKIFFPFSVLGSEVREVEVRGRGVARKRRGGGGRERPWRLWGNEGAQDRVVGMGLPRERETRACLATLDRVDRFYPYT